MQHLMQTSSIVGVTESPMALNVQDKKRQLDAGCPQARLLEPLVIESMELWVVRLPLLEPFETSMRTETEKSAVLVCLRAGDLEGWGEITAEDWPSFSYETIRTALIVIENHFAPEILKRPFHSLADVADRLVRFRGHNMAKAGVELAFMDLLARAAGEPLSVILGGCRSRIPVGVSLGIQQDFGELEDRIAKYLALGYQRIKLKIKRGMDVQVVARVRERYPDINLSVDANSAYVTEDIGIFKSLDSMSLSMIEQPFQADELIEHAELQAQMKTPICLDESITSLVRAKQAIRLQSCRIINVKVGRVGGYREALAIHDFCEDSEIAVWCGGMMESGIGRAHNVALASLPNFSLPGDISASARYFERDLVNPAIQVDAEGFVAVPLGAGIGVQPDVRFIREISEHHRELDKR